MKARRLLAIAAVAALALNCSSPAFAQATKSTTKQSNEAERSQNAANVLKEIMDAPDKGIPDSLMQKAVGIAVSHMS